MSGRQPPTVNRQPRQCPERSAPRRTETDAERIVAAVKRIPRGRVSTYGAVAQLAGLPRRARLVGTVLRTAPPKLRLPWHRVINASGRISFPQGSDAYRLQRSRLEAEGVTFSSTRIDLTEYGWPSECASLDEYLWHIGDR